MYCKCGDKIPQARIDALTLNGKLPVPKSLSCIKCSSTQRVAGFMPTDHKMRGNIIIADQDTVEALENANWRTGTGVSRGMKSKVN